MASRSITDLNQRMQELHGKFIAGCSAIGIDVLTYCTLRSNEEQDALYKIGRSIPGKISTNARAGESSHNPDKNNKSAAFDCVPLLHGKPQWNDKATYLKMGAIGESVGLKWAGRWTGKLREVAHFSETGK